MAFEVQIRVTPDVGVFPPGAFEDLLHRGIQMPGLDPAWNHTLIDAQVAGDGSHAALTVHSTPKAQKSLDRALRVVSWQPTARVKAFDRDGTELVAVERDAPLQVGDVVDVGGETHRVVEVEHPHRGPGGCTPRGVLDWQHVTLHPEPTPPHVPTLAAEEPNEPRTNNPPRHAAAPAPGAAEPGDPADVGPGPVRGGVDRPVE